MFSLANEGNKKAAIIIKLQDEIELVLSAILTCATILNALAVALITEMFSHVFGDFAVIFAPLVTSVFIVLFAEVLPKMLTISNPEDVLLPSAYFIKYTHKLLRPLNHIIGAIAKRLIFLIKLPSKKEKNEYADSLDELRGAIALHKGQDIEDVKKEKEMLQSVLDLGTTHVGNIMIHRKNVTMFCVDEDIDTLVDQIMKCRYTRVPLWSGNQDNIVGVLHISDLLKTLKKSENIEEINIMEITSEPWFIPENKDLLDQLQSFRQRHAHFAIVVDEYGSFMGIITLEDIIEEIVGDIMDEHDNADVADVGIRQQEDGSYLVNGTVNVRDLNREIGTKFRNDIAATVAGLIINSIGIIPETGQTFVLQGHKFEILKRQRNQVTLLKIKKLYEDGEEDGV
jgi:Mg2+/Co2+ transporter CorB